MGIFAEMKRSSGAYMKLTFSTTSVTELTCIILGCITEKHFESLNLVASKRQLSSICDSVNYVKNGWNV